MSQRNSQQWEYTTYRPPEESRAATMKEVSDPKAALNELGEEGWQLVNTIDYTGGGTKFLVLRRPVNPETE